ncbi:MAG: 1-acyl-sn-glycerol-3-phosphate acyltransferase, partial [Oscillospiraceae bacterium]|nr:1-acyl-sn-glycerol-3-phosphate acyltransferase [Oscillospiraceae bacterium]
MAESLSVRRHRLIYQILRPAVRLYLRHAFNFVPPPLIEDEAPFLVVCNHVTDLGMLYFDCSFRTPMYFIASEHTMRAGFASKLLDWCFAPIVRKKATVAAATALEAKRRVKDGHSIGLFGEGERSSDGVNRPVIDSTGSLARMLNCRLYTMRLHGGYFSSPRWGKGIRRGQLTLELVNTYEPQTLRAMKGEEITAILNRDIYVDAYADNEETPIAFYGKKPAEGIEHALLACPRCGALNSINSQGNHFGCHCGMNGRYDEFGLLHGIGFSFSTITQWSAWAAEHIAALPETEENTILCHDEDQVLREIFPDHTAKITDTGTLILTRDVLSVGSTRLPLDKMETIDIIGHGFLLVNMRDGR